MIKKVQKIQKKNDNLVHLSSITKCFVDIKKLILDIHNYLLSSNQEIEIFVKLCKSLVILANSMVAVFFNQDIIFEMLSTLRISLKLDFMLKCVDSSYEFNWAGRIVTFTNLAYAYYKYQEKEICVDQTNYIVRLLDVKKKIMNKAYNKFDLELSIVGQTMVSFILYQYGVQDECLQYSSELFSLLGKQMALNDGIDIQNPKSTVVNIINIRMIAETLILSCSLTLKPNKFNVEIVKEQIQQQASSSTSIDQMECLKHLEDIRSQYDYQVNREFDRNDGIEQLIDRDKVIYISKLQNMKSVNQKMQIDSKSLTKADPLENYDFEKSVIKYILLPFSSPVSKDIDEEELLLVYTYKYIFDPDLYTLLIQNESLLNNLHKEFTDTLIKKRNQIIRNNIELKMTDKEIPIDDSKLYQVKSQPPTPSHVEYKVQNSKITLNAKGKQSQVQLTLDKKKLPMENLKKVQRHILINHKSELGYISLNRHNKSKDKSMTKLTKNDTRDPYRFYQNPKIIEKLAMIESKVLSKNKYENARNVINYLIQNNELDSSHIPVIQFEDRYKYIPNSSYLKKRKHKHNTSEQNASKETNITSNISKIQDSRQDQDIVKQTNANEPNRKQDNSLSFLNSQKEVENPLDKIQNINYKMHAAFTKPMKHLLSNDSLLTKKTSIKPLNPDQNDYYNENMLKDLSQHPLIDFAELNIESIQNEVKDSLEVKESVNDSIEENHQGGLSEFKNHNLVNKIECRKIKGNTTKIPSKKIIQDFNQINDPLHVFPVNFNIREYSEQRPKHLNMTPNSKDVNEKLHSLNEKLQNLVRTLPKSANNKNQDDKNPFSSKFKSENNNQFNINHNVSQEKNQDSKIEIKIGSGVQDEMIERIPTREREPRILITKSNVNIEQVNIFDNFKHKKVILSSESDDLLKSVDQSQELGGVILTTDKNIKRELYQVKQYQSQGNFN